MIGIEVLELLGGSIGPSNGQLTDACVLAESDVLLFSSHAHESAGWEDIADNCFRIGFDGDPASDAVAIGSSALEFDENAMSLSDAVFEQSQRAASDGPNQQVEVAVEVEVGGDGRARIGVEIGV